ncbi:hypothetical protein RB195_024569 [Necator americanus]|uniref:Uncharacterized protein n=1 Tax=Necator americanus TaxID=51031 RepID=A0ABR1EQY1_NECAM
MTRTTVAVRTPAGTTPFHVVTGIREGAVTGSFLSNIDDIMRRTVHQCLADSILAPSRRHLTDLEYDPDDVVTFAETSAKLQHIEKLCTETASCSLWTTSTP